MKRTRPRLVLLALVSAVAAGTGHAAELPTPEGWRPAGKTETYDRKTVWQAIDGAAELFVSYGFASLRTRDYAARTDKARITVQIYEQTSALGAFGVFQREGGGASQACLGLKGRHYIKVLAIQGELGGERCKRLLAALRSALPGDDALPRELALLPARGQVPGSLGYTRESFLGTRRLQRCLHASYARKAAKPYTLFVVLPGPKQGAQDVWKALASHWKPVRQGGLEVISTAIPYKGTVALLRRDGAVLGAVGVGDLAATVALLRGLPRAR